jgi:hypothetical protein
MIALDNSKKNLSSMSEGISAENGRKYKSEEDTNMMKNGWRALETTFMHVFANHRRRFSNRILISLLR